MLVLVVATIIWLGISAFTVFGGADFGAGMWDLIAGDAKRGREPRRLIEASIGPVWEANHVWLIFVLVYFWTAFPVPFVSFATTLWIPLTLAAFGIIFRGAGFAFRKSADTMERQRFYGAAFAASSVLTPFGLGMVVGAVASARVPLGNAAGDVWGSWLNPTSFLCGTLAVAAFAFGAAVLLAFDANRQGSTDLAGYFRRRALISGGGTLLVALVGIPVVRSDAPGMYATLGSAVGVVFGIGLVVGGVGSLVALGTRRYRAARPLGIMAILSLLWGWGAGQYPWVLHQVARAKDYAAGEATLWALVAAFVAATGLAVPALLALYRLAQRGDLHPDRSLRADSTDALMESLAGRKSSGDRSPRG